MTRIAILTPDQMNDEQRAVIDASKANGRPHGGPFWAYIRNPKLMQSVQNTAACIADCTLSAREQRSALPTDDKREFLAQRIANELLADKGLSDATYASADTAFSTEELVALVARVGAFSMTCCTANAFDITPPDDAPDRLYR